MPSVTEGSEEVQRLASPWKKGTKKKSTLLGTAVLNSCWNPCNPILSRLERDLQARRTSLYRSPMKQVTLMRALNAPAFRLRTATPYLLAPAKVGRSLLSRLKPNCLKLLVSAYLLAHAILNKLCEHFCGYMPVALACLRARLSRPQLDYLIDCVGFSICVFWAESLAVARLLDWLSWRFYWTGTSRSWCQAATVSLPDCVQSLAAGKCRAGCR